MTEAQNTDTSSVPMTAEPTEPDPKSPHNSSWVELPTLLNDGLDDINNTHLSRLVPYHPTSGAVTKRPVGRIETSAVPSPANVVSLPAAVSLLRLTVSGSPSMEAIRSPPLPSDERPLEPN